MHSRLHSIASSSASSSRDSLDPLLKENDSHPFYLRTPPLSPLQKPLLRWPSPPITPRRIVIVCAVFFLSFFTISLGRRVFASSRVHEFDIVLHPSEAPYVGNHYKQEQYAWSEESFLPDALPASTHINQQIWSRFGHNFSSPSKEHSIVTFPQEIKLQGLPHPVKAEEVVFGFATTFRRAREMSEYWSHYLHGSQCLIVLPPEEEHLFYALDYFLRTERKITSCKITTAKLGKYPRYEHRYMELPRRMYLQEWKDKDGALFRPKYYVVGDDDTQWLDMRSLLREMSTRDSDKHHLLCGITESNQQRWRHGDICFGGGGIVISAQLAKQMAERMEECLWWHTWRFGGDEMITHCASTVSGIPVDKVFENHDGIHQCDIPGDITGLIQSGQPILSLHHWLSWIEIFPWFYDSDKAHNMKLLQQAVNFLGGDNLFKRFVFDDGRTLVSLGHSITFLSSPLRHSELDKIETTYRTWEHTLRWPERPLVPEGRIGAKGRFKTTYYLREVRPEEGLMVYKSWHNDIIRMHWRPKTRRVARTV